MNENEAMKRALDLAMLGTGEVSPNPRVGAVILKDGEKIGEGYHTKFGADHAEIEAIRSAGLEDFSGCSMVINLEPCTHFGKTPPCADKIIEMNFSKVVIGMEDPNPEVAGNGIKKLRDAGIEVESGYMKDECIWLNRAFIKHIRTGMPYVILKIAQSFDGNIASSEGESKWISSEESRRRSHILRAYADAVLVGKGTVEKDDPSLTVRNAKGRNPKRVIIDKDLKLPEDLNVFRDSERFNTIVCCSGDAGVTRKAEDLKISGVKILQVENDENGKLVFPSMLKALYENYNIASVMVEGGKGIYSAFAADDLIDEVQLFIAPKLFGGALQSFGSFMINDLSESVNFRIKALSMSGPDVHIIAIKEE